MAFLRRLALLALAIPCTALVAQTAAPPRIAGIVLERHNVFDASETGHWIPRLVNRLHVTTLHRVIGRELLFDAGDRFDTLRLAETERNLRRLGVFRDVALDTVRTDSGMVVHVVTRDGWSTRPDFRFHSTGGSIAYTLALIEDNLFGTVTQTQLLYRKDPDRTTTVAQFAQPRLIAGTVGLAMTFFNRSDGELLTATVGQPFFSHGSRHALSADIDTRRERLLLFRDGAPVAADTLQRRYVLGRVSAAKALATPPGGYLRVGVTAQIRRDDFATQSVADVTNGIPTRSVTGAVGATIEQRRGTYLKVRGFRSFGREEDVDLSRVVRASVMLAPKGLGYDRDGIAPGLAMQIGSRFAGGFLQAEASASGLFTRAGLDSGQVQVGLTTVFFPAERQHLVLHAEAGLLRDPLPGAEFDLGLGVGPRAFREHSFTGDREYFLTAEYRYVLAPELFKVVGVGLAAFAEHGGAGWRGSPMRSGTDVGIGLRLGASRANDQEVSRIDLARRFGTDREPGGWVLVVGKGFVFGSR